MLVLTADVRLVVEACLLFGDGLAGCAGFAQVCHVHAVAGSSQRDVRAVDTELFCLCLSEQSSAVQQSGGHVEV